MNLLALIAQGEHQQQDFKYKVEDSAKLARTVSAFANTDGGRLLIGVNDDGRIVGVQGEEEIFMMKAAATRYCTPQPLIEFETVRHDGRVVVVCTVPPSNERPVYALEDIRIDPRTGRIDHKGRRTAYIRIADENIVASPVLLSMWREERQAGGQVVSMSDAEQQVLHALDSASSLTLGQLVRLSRVPRRRVVGILTRFIRYGLVQWAFRDRTFVFSAV